MASRTSVFVSFIAYLHISIASGTVYSNGTSNSTAIGRGTGRSSVPSLSIIQSSSGVSSKSTTEETFIGGYIASALGVTQASSTSSSHTADSTVLSVPTSNHGHSDGSFQSSMLNSSTSCVVTGQSLTRSSLSSGSLIANSTSPSLSVLPHGHSNGTSHLPTYKSFNHTSSYTVTAVHTVLHTSVVATGYTGGNTNASSIYKGTRSKVPSHPSGAPSMHGTGYLPSNGTTSKPTYYTSGLSSGHGTSLATSASYKNRTTGSGYIYANACNQASVSWSKRYISQWVTPCSGVYPDTVYTAPPSSAYYSLCDGIPRMRFNTTTTATPFSSVCEMMTTAANAPPQPNCTILPSDCASLLATYSVVHDVPPHVTLGRAHLYYSYIPNDFPRCTTNSISCSSAGADCGVYGNGIQLMYWPQTWEGGFCGPKQQSVTLGPTIPGRPNTAKLFNTTFTSPTVYIKYETLWASDYCDAPVGTTLYNGFVPVDSAVMSTKLPYYWTNMPWEGEGGLMDIVRNTGIISARWYGGYPGIMDEFADEIVPLVYPDLDGPVPAIPYYQARAKTAYYDPWCWDGGGCPTMMPWEYQPVLAIPEVMRTLAPEWLSCTLPWGAMNDPPTALASISALASVTEPSQPTGPSATPCVTAQPVHETSSTAGGDRTSPGVNSEPAQAQTGTKKSSSTQNDPTGKPNPDPDSAILPPAPSHTSAGTHDHDPAPEHNSQNPSATDPSQSPSPDPASSSDLHTAATASQDGGGKLVSVLANSGKPATSPNADPNQAPDSTPQTPAGGGNSAKPANGQTANTPAENSPSPGNDGGGVPITIGSQTFTVRPAAGTTGAAVVGSKTIITGGSAISIQGHSVSLGSGGKLSVDGSSAGVPLQSYQQTKSGVGGDDTIAAITLGSQVVTAHRAAGSSNVVVIGSQTLEAGGSEVAVDGHSVSLGRNGRLAVDGSSAGIVNLQPAPKTTGLSGTLAAVTLGSQTIYAEETTRPDGQTEAIVGHQTLTIGGSAATVSGHVVSAGSSGLVIEPQVSTIAFHHSTAYLPAGSLTLTARQTGLPNGATAAIIDGTTLASGTVATVSGEVISLGSQGLVIGTGGVQTVALGGGSTAQIIVGSTTLNARETVLQGGQTAAVIDGSTIASGIPATVNGEVVSFGSHGLVVEPSSQVLAFSDSTAFIPAGTSTPKAYETILSNGEKAAIIDGTTVTSGQTGKSIDGEFISFGHNGLVVQNPALTATFAATTAQITLAGSETLTARETTASNGQTEAIIGTHTLTQGGSATMIDGETISFGPSGLVVRAGTATTAAFESSAALVTIGSHTLIAHKSILADGKTEAIVGTDTLFLGGPAATIDGERVSFGPDGIVVGPTGGAKSMSPLTAGASITAAAVKEGSGGPTTTTSGAAYAFSSLWRVVLLGLVGYIFPDLML